MAKIIETIKKAVPGDMVTLVTHQGKFHADDVCSTALLELLFEKIGVKTELVRTFKPAEEGYTDETPMTIVYDIGLGMYDHHQVGDDVTHCIRIDTNSEGEEIQRKYAAVGLIWKEIGEIWLGKYADNIYSSIIKAIDDQDNGFSVNPLSIMIGNMNPSFSDPSPLDYNKAFRKAVDVMKDMFADTIFHYEYIRNCEKFLMAEAANSDGACLVTDKFLPGADAICRERGIGFYVYPNQRGVGEYCFKTITSTPDVNSPKICDIPDEVRNWEGVTFLHPSCFLGSAVSKERAIEICHILMNK